MPQHEGLHPPDQNLLLGADLPFMEDIADDLLRSIQAFYLR